MKKKKEKNVDKLKRCCHFHIEFQRIKMLKKYGIYLQKEHLIWANVAVDIKIYVRTW